MGKELEITGEERDIGVIIDNKLNFEAHISKKNQQSKFNASSNKKDLPLPR